MIIRNADEKDYVQLKHIGMVCYDKTVEKKQQSWITRFLFKRYFSKNKFKERYHLGVLIRCLEIENNIVGFYELEESGCLSSLYVLPEHHKKGYGKMLLKDAYQNAKLKKINEIYLDSSLYAVNFYKKYGFKEVKKPTVILGVWMQRMKNKID